MLIEHPNPHLYNINRTVKCKRNKIVIYVRYDTRKNVFQDMFSVLRFPLDASYYYVYISPAYLPNRYHGTISYKKKTRNISALVWSKLSVWNKVKCQLDATRLFYWCILSSTCFGYIRPSSGALDVELQHMVSCTEFLEGWWSWEPLRRSCLRCGWCRAAVICYSVVLKNPAVIHLVNSPPCKEPKVSLQSLAYPGTLFKGGVNKFSWGQRTERTGIWGR